MMGADGSPGAGDASVNPMRRSHMDQVTEFLEFAGSILSLATALLGLVDRLERRGGKNATRREGGEGTADRDAN
jgi:hypothetical protein